MQVLEALPQEAAKHTIEEGTQKMLKLRPCLI